MWALSAGGVLGALGAMAAVLLVSRKGRSRAPTQLILCGVVLSALFESVTSFLIFRGNPQATQAVLKQSFTSVSWEQVIKADPQCIVINDYGTPTAAQKEKFLETSEITRDLSGEEPVLPPARL